jgi:PD-(D/E)XK nuclease superfamily protein
MATPKKGYFTADGLKIPSVTTIIGRFKESGALIRWAYSQGEQGVPLYSKRDAAADVGSYVHTMIEAFLTSGEIEISPPAGMSPENVEKAASAYQAFRTWLDGSRLRVTPLEQHYVSETHRFGGTPDAIAEAPDDLRELLDWKTAKSFYADQLVQVAAYRALYNEVHPERPINGGVHIVRFGKDGGDFQHLYFPATHRKLAAAWRMFVLFREAFDLDKVVTGRDD